MGMGIAGCGCTPQATPVQSPQQQGPGGGPLDVPAPPADPILDAFDRQYQIKIDFRPEAPDVAAAVSDIGKIVASRTQRVNEIGAAIQSTQSAGEPVPALATLRFELERSTLPLWTGLSEAIRGVQQYLDGPSATDVVEGAKSASATGGLALSRMAQGYAAAAVRAGTITQAQADQAIAQLRDVDAQVPGINERSIYAGTQLQMLIDRSQLTAPGTSAGLTPQQQAQFEAQVPEIAAIHADTQAMLATAAAALRSIGVNVPQ
jgi:hypothetical protein